MVRKTNPNKKVGVLLLILLTVFSLAFLLADYFTYHFIFAPKTSRLVNPLPAVLGVTNSPRGETLVSTLKPLIVANPFTESLNAKALLIVDLTTHTNLIDKNSTTTFPIASLTKLLTALLVYENLNLNDTITITAGGINDTNPTLGLKIGDEVKISDLFNAMIIGSANDAALTLAKEVEKKTGVKFTELMNLKAAALGMHYSHFSNPLGFDSYHNFSTAEDLKLLALETQKYTAFASLGRMNEYAFKSLKENSYRISATNKLLEGLADLESVKTGYSKEALGSIILKLAIHNRKILIILLGSTDRDKETLALRQWLLLNVKLP